MRKTQTRVAKKKNAIKKRKKCCGFVRAELGFPCLKGNSLCRVEITRRISQVFLCALASRWIAFCTRISNWDAHKKELQLGPDYFFPGGNFTPFPKIHLMWFSFRWLSQSYSVLLWFCKNSDKCAVCIWSGCERFSKSTNWFLFNLRAIIRVWKSQET